ncbi:MAG: hypothetical protein ABEI39_03575 [Halobacteriales archaeon]
MSLWLEVARGAAGLNTLLLAGLGIVWWRRYRRHGARHTLVLLVVGGFLFAENLLWTYLYFVESSYVSWFTAVGPGLQAGITGLCGLELVALAALATITLR